jgi:FSR family fosmidomycin resistance protein-like MFS transporter
VSAVAFPAARIDRRGIGLLAFGHLAADLVQGAVPPLLPFLVRDRGYSYAAAGSLLLFSSVGSSLLQPLLGAFADRIRATWLMPAGSVLGGVGIALVAVTNSYLATGAALAVASVGVAMYHPEAVRFADAVSRASGRRGAGMSVFAVGGLTGWALGPLIVTPAVLLFGLPGIALVAVIPFAAAILLFADISYVEQYRASPGSARAIDEADATTESRWGAFGFAVGAATARSSVQTALQAFVPLYLWKVLHADPGPANLIGSVLLGAGAVGALVGGNIADRFGFRPLVVWSLAVAAPLVAALSFVPVPVVFGLMALIGFTMEANFYPLALAAQNAVPRHIGFSAGMTLGVSIGAAAGVVALLGVLADAEGLRAALYATAGIELGACLLSRLVPRAVYDPDRVPAATAT